MNAHVSIIVAVSENNIIGRQGEIPWRLKSDLARFKQITRDHTVIVGRKTQQSIERHLGHALPDRTTVVVSSRSPGGNFPTCTVVSSLSEAVIGREGELFVIGGAELYRIALRCARKLYLTRVHANVNGDVSFPAYDPREWVIEPGSCIHVPVDENNEYPSTFQIFHRR